MTTKPTHKSCRFSLRFVSQACALLVYSALAALAVSSARADVVFTRSTATGEHWAHYTATYTAPYSGNYTLGINVTAGGPSGDNSILIDDVQVTNGATTLFADGFETPALSPNTGSGSSLGNTTTIGNWLCTNSSGILNGSPPNWGLAGQGLGSADGTSQYGFLQAVAGTLPTIKASNTLPLVGGQTYTVSFYQASRNDFGGTTTYTVTLDCPPPTVYASGLSAVTAWDPIFPAGHISPDSSEGKPVPTVGYSANWVNPHAATAFPRGSHPWEGIVPYNFNANWINAWTNINSNGHGKTSSSPGWSGYPYYGVPDQSWTKYSLPVYGEGDFVLQFLADNASWIYVDGNLVGYQDYSWSTNGTGRYTIQLSGGNVHELSFVIWDGGGLAGGKFRLETKASFIANNPGVTLPPSPASVTLSNLTQTYDGTPKSVTAITSPGGLSTSITYNGSTTAPTNVGSYNVVATVTTAGYLGSATGTLTIGKATATLTLGNLTQTYDGSAKSITVTPTPSSVGYAINYLGDNTNAGSCPVLVAVNDPNYTGSASGTLTINKATSTTTTVGADPFTYDGTSHAGGSGTVTGAGVVTGAATLTYTGDQVNAGSYTVTAHYAGDANHTASDGAPVTITINKATSTTTTVGAGPFTYDGTSHAGGSGTVTGAGVVSGAATLTYTGDQINAGSYTVTAHYAGDANHTASDGAPVTITINKATSTTTTVGAGPFTYDGTPHAGGSGTVTGAGVVTGAATLTYTGDQVNAGSYTVTAHYAGDANHTASDGAPVAITINKAISTTTTVGAGPFTYDGTPHVGGSGTVTGAGVVTGAATLTVSANADGTGTADQTDAGTYYVTAHYAGDANHLASDGVPVAITIAKANATVVVTPYSVIYDGNPHSATVTSITGVNGESGATVGAVTLNTTHTDVGTYADTWSFAGANYNAIAATPITDTITGTATASLVPLRRGGDDESTQSFTVVFSATDAAALAPGGLTATLNGIAVTNGQVVQLRVIKSGAQRIERDDGRLHMSATSFTLTVVATYANNYTTTATAAPVFNKHGKDSEDDKSRTDSKDTGKSDDDKSGGKKRHS